MTWKAILGLAYFWCGSQNAVELQLWSTWIVYTMLIDRGDEVAGLLKLPYRHNIKIIDQCAYKVNMEIEPYPENEIALLRYTAEIE